jgi:hypothetical protein
MIQTMLTTIGAPVATRGIEAQRQAFMLRKIVGFAIVASGFAVIAAQAFQHVLGT